MRPETILRVTVLIPGTITEEFVAAGDFLTYKFGVWTWYVMFHATSTLSLIHGLTHDYREAGEASRARDYLPADKQYLVTRGVACLRRATSLAYNDEERLLSIGELSTKKGEDEWVETHTGRASGEGAGGEPAVIDEIPDVDEHDGVSQAMSGMSLSSGKAADAADIPDIDDIPDMEEEDLEGEDDAAVVAPKKATTSGVVDAKSVCFTSHTP